MKKIFYLILFTTVFFAGCDPMDDIYTELDAQGNTFSFTGDTEITLSDDDYDALNLNYGNFNSVDDAKAMIPSLLTEKYPTWGEFSSALVTFKVYNPVKTYSGNVYELSDAEHNEITGNTYGNFDRDYHIYDYLEANYPSPSEGDFVSLRYRFYNGGEVTLTDGFAYEDGEWKRFQGFTEAQYEAMGEGYPNFSSHDEAEQKIPIALEDVYKFDPKSAGDIVSTMYELYAGGGVTKSYTTNYIFDGTSWSKYNNVENVTLQFGHDGTTWVPDNTIKYTLTLSDYDLIVTSLSDKYEAATSSMDSYGNFDRRPGNSAEWTDDMVVEALGIVLDNLDSSAEEGQKYVVTFDIYNGSNATEIMSLIKTGGVWVLNE